MTPRRAPPAVGRARTADTPNCEKVRATAPGKHFSHCRAGGTAVDTVTHGGEAGRDRRCVCRGVYLTRGARNRITPPFAAGSARGGGDCAAPRWPALPCRRGDGEGAGRSVCQVAENHGVRRRCMSRTISPRPAPGRQAGHVAEPRFGVELHDRRLDVAGTQCVAPAAIGEACLPTVVHRAGSTLHGPVTQPGVRSNRATFLTGWGESMGQ